MIWFEPIIKCDIIIYYFRMFTFLMPMFTFFCYSKSIARRSRQMSWLPSPLGAGACGCWSGATGHLEGATWWRWLPQTHRSSSTRQENAQGGASYWRVRKINFLNVKTNYWKYVVMILCNVIHKLLLLVHFIWAYLIRY